MPTTATAPAPKTAAPLFLGLQSYTEAQAGIFFGRDDEIDRLTNLVKANTLTIVFGKSGTGKTSLLNAGVFPRLRKEYCLPFRIRLEFGDESPGLVAQIKHVLKEEIDKYGFRVEAYPGAETLWEYFHHEQLWRSVTPILIFDQFEEIFTLGRKSARFGKEELDAFWEELADLIENSVPDSIKARFLNDKENFDAGYKVQKIKMLFSFREEFLPEFEGITAKIPSLKYSRFRLLPMNGHQAYEVITKTWKGAINTAQAQKIVDFFSASGEEHQAYELMTVEPSLLSQVCSLIEKERLHKGKDKISAEFLDQYSKAFILRSIYDEAVSESNRAVKATDSTLTAERPVNVFVEDKLITDEGYRTKYALSEQDRAILPGIAVLRNKYFVRDEGKSLELTHDVLTPLIKSDREERRKELALVAAKKKVRRRVMLITAVAVAAALGFWYFTAGKALQKQEEAEHKAEALALKSDSTSKVLDSTKKLVDDAALARNEIALQIKNLRDSLNRLHKDTTNSIPLSDSAWAARLLEQSQRDSQRLSQLNKQLAEQKIEWEGKDSSSRAQLQSFTFTQKKSDSANKSAQREIVSLKRRIVQDSNTISQMQTRYNNLVKAQQVIYTEFPDLLQAGNVVFPFDAAADTNSLKLELFHGAKKGKVPDNLKVYLLPRTAANQKIIKRASLYEYRCEEGKLDKAQDRQIARYHNGSYVFLNVPPGDYFVKVCDYCGGYYNLSKKAQGNVTFGRDAWPPLP